MTSSNHPRFRLLVGWSCLMSSALLIIIVYLATRTSWHKTSEKNKPESQHGDHSKSDNVTKSDQNIDFPNGSSFNDYIRLIRDKEKLWICSDSCESSSLSLKNGSVEITVGGMYYIHAQVGIEKLGYPKETEMKTTVILFKNKGPGIQQRRLSEVTRFEPGSLTLIRLVRLAKRDSISLNIDYEKKSMHLLEDEYHTYWEIILFSNKQ